MFARPSSFTVSTFLKWTGTSVLYVIATTLCFPKARVRIRRDACMFSFCLLDWLLARVRNQKKEKDDTSNECSANVIQLVCIPLFKQQNNYLSRQPQNAPNGLLNKYSSGCLPLIIDTNTWVLYLPYLTLFLIKYFKK